MWMVFLDESGYTPDWKTGIETQPYYTLSAVCIAGQQLVASYAALRKGIEDLNVPTGQALLGKGHEIKAREVACGSGWWGTHTDERNGVRELMLGFPAANGGVAFIVVIDKAAHAAKYYTPDNPYLLSMQFILERIQHFLSDVDGHAILVYDHNKRLEPDLSSHTCSLLGEGSDVIFHSKWQDATLTFTLQLNRIVELSFGNSKGSLGIQVADFIATFAYQYFKAGKPTYCGWWDTLVGSLHRKSGVLDGVGLKVFP